jgi:hypothetical protein
VYKFQYLLRKLPYILGYVVLFTLQVFASATEDMDCLTFGSNIVLRHLTASEAKKLPIREINLDRVLSSLELQRDEVNMAAIGHLCVA